MTYDPAAHAYYDDQGARVPSVTQILQSAGLCGDPRYYRAGSADRGSRVHLALEEIVKFGEVKVEGRDPIHYGGTVDLVGEGMLVDYKTGSPAPWHRVQLCAYGLALGHSTLGALYLKRGKPAVLRIVSKLEMEDGRAAWRKAASEWGGWE
jgi:hypothetical protein